MNLQMFQRSQIPTGTAKNRNLSLRLKKTKRINIIGTKKKGDLGKEMIEKRETTPETKTITERVVKINREEGEEMIEAEAGRKTEESEEEVDLELSDHPVPTSWMSCGINLIKQPLP